MRDGPIIILTGFAVDVRTNCLETQSMSGCDAVIGVMISGRGRSGFIAFGMTGKLEHPAKDKAETNDVSDAFHRDSIGTE